jgi:hypothetical protein
MRFVRQGLMIGSVALVGACGSRAPGAVSQDLQVPPPVEEPVESTSADAVEPEPPTAIVGVDAPNSYAQLVESAEWYLPTYENGAADLDGLGDRESAASADLDLWRDIEARVGDGLGTGERAFEDPGAALESEAGMSAAEANAAEVRISEDLAGLGLDLESMPQRSFYSPFFAELAEVCGAPAAIAIYSAAGDDEPAVLQQYVGVEAKASTALPTGLSGAWEFSLQSDLAVGYVLQYVDSAEVVAVVTVSTNECTIQDVVDQVGIERKGQS